MATMRVGLVAPEREVWTGEAEIVVARTLDGDIGVLPGHAPLLGVLAEGGVVRIRPEGGDDIVAAVDGGFLSVSSDGVSVLGEFVQLADEIDTGAVRRELDRARSEEDEQAVKRLEGRLRAAGEE